MRRGSTSEVAGERKVRLLWTIEKSKVGGERLERWIRGGRGEGWER